LVLTASAAILDVRLVGQKIVLNNFTHFIFWHNFSHCFGSSLDIITEIAWFVFLVIKRETCKNAGVASSFRSVDAPITEDSSGIFTAPFLLTFPGKIPLVYCQQLRALLLNEVTSSAGAIDYLTITW
jgi:hypothetical protein